MQVSVETTSGLERRLTIGVPAKVIDSEVEKRIKDAAGTVKLNGFRKGKVPIKVVKQKFGAGIRQEVVGDTINRSFYEAVQKEDLKPAGAPQIEPKEMASGKDVEFVATFEVYPEVTVADVSDIEIEKLTADIAEKDVDQMIETLRGSQASFKAVQRAAKNLDQVTIDFLGKKDGEPFAGGEAKGHKLVLGSNSMIPGFEDGIVGMKAGDEKVIDVTFPDDYQSEDLKGQSVTFDIQVHEVEEKELPELNEEFFKKFGVEEGGLEKFRVEVNKNMEREKLKAVKNKTKEQVMNALIKKNEFDVPKALIDSEIDALRNQMLQQYGEAAKNIDAKSILPDDMFKAQAEKRVALGLILNAYVEQQKLKADKDKVRELIEEAAATYESPEEVINYYYSNQQMLANMESLALEDQVIDDVLSKAKVEEKKVSYEELVKPNQNAA